MASCLAGAALLAATMLFGGCGDQPLPGDWTPVVKPSGIVFTEVDDPRIWSAGTRIVVVEDGGAQRSLGDGVLMARPGARSIAFVNGATTRILTSGLDSGSSRSTVATLPDSSSARFDGFTVAVSPGGNRVAFERTMTKIDGSGLVQLPYEIAHETTPAFSPDGTRLAFFAREVDVTGSGPGGRVYTIHVDGTGLRQIATVMRLCLDGAHILDWSPDGTMLAYHDGADNVVYTARADGTGTGRIVDGIHPRWSPDGTKLLYTGRDYELHIVDANGGNDMKLTATSAIAELYPQWSPDGTKVLYIAVAGTVNETPGALTVLDLSSNTTQVLSIKAFRAFWFQ